MLQTGLSHGVAIIPNAPKQRYSDPETGAHFEFEDMCTRLEKLKKKRFLDEMQSTRKGINKDFMKTGELKPTTQALEKNLKGSTHSNKKDLGPEEVLEESEFPMKARRVQNFVNTTHPKTNPNLLVHHRSSKNNEALVEIEEAEEPSIHLPPKQRISDKPANM